MVAGGGETGNAPGVARVLRAALAPRLTCPLCKGYFRDANAFKQCGHTFCLECIMKKIDEEEIETCPVCDDALGIAPEEKLRADESIQAIRDSVFPHETEVDASEPPTITLPATIEERSISNFVETPKMAPKSTKMTISANKNKNSADISKNGKNHETIGKEELYKPLRSLIGSSAKKSKKSSSCISKNKATTEHSSRESTEEDSHDRITTPVWFSLLTAPKQAKAKRLPQIENNFYRIKDGTMQVSSILKLLIKKLELASDAKVEILCHDKSVCPSTTLQGLLKRWLSCKPKDKVQRPVGAPADEFVMELHYRQCLGSKYLCSAKKITSLICHCST
ncbi:E3 ubiquitin protein ligase DRIP1-like [Hordeum vulgare subsp. vulgare]|uniref:E3 ubiquitin protein ligase DRIP1-like n=1 Tax=Hordeum vulgare subsp. vulgare TaxID=112509 RepID=UPI001D1A57E0|nr:E3 ubiquitin protein ligase DRIP1-like [Hordeum vulgare subsp. vulgare]